MNAIRVLFTNKVNVWIGPYYRNSSTFAEQWIKMRKKSHDTKGVAPIMYCFRRRHLRGSKSHAGYSIPLCLFISDGSLFPDVVKNSWPVWLWYWLCVYVKWRLPRWGLGVAQTIISFLRRGCYQYLQTPLWNAKREKDQSSTLKMSSRMIWMSFKLSFVNRSVLWFCTSVIYISTRIIFNMVI